MIGFVTTKEQADAVNAAIAKAQTDRGLPVFWLAGSFPIYNGEHEGKYFIPCDEEILSTPLMGKPIQTPMDLTEFVSICQSLGGLNARIDLSESDIIPID